MVDEVLTTERVKIGFSAKDKEDLLLKLCRNLKVKDWKQIHKSVIKREKIMSTGIGDGIAIPRGYTKNHKKPIGYLAILKNMIDYNSLDRKPVKITLLLVFPNKYKKYGGTIATFIELLAQESIKRHLVNLKDEDKIIRFLSSREEE